jgi:hypothetical protein
MQVGTTLLFFITMCGCIMNLDLSPLRQPSDGESEIQDAPRGDGDGVTDGENEEADAAAPAWWARSYGGTSDDEAAAVEAGEAGEIIVAGDSLSFDTGSAAIWTLMLDGRGAIVWQAALHRDLTQRAHDVIKARDGGYLLAGDAETVITGTRHLWILKLKGDGQIDWELVSGRSEADVPAAVRQTSDGGYIAAGQTEPSAGSEADLLVVKLGESGELYWAKSLGSTGSDQGLAVDQISGGGYVVAGRSSSFGSGDDDAWIIRLQADGNGVWQKRCGGPGDDTASSVLQTQGGSTIVAGTTWSSGAGGADFWVFEIDSGGAVTWQRTYGGPGSDEALSIAPTQDGGAVVAGSSDSWGTGSGDTNALVLKLDEGGTVAWAKTYGGSGADLASAVTPSADGGYILAGRTTSYGAGGSDFWVLRIDGEGNIPGSCPPGFIKAVEPQTEPSAVTPLQTNVAVVDVTGEMVRDTPNGSTSLTDGLVDEQCSGP